MKESRTTKTLIIIVLLVIVLILGTTFFVYMHPSYKVKDRVSKLKSYQRKDSGYKTEGWLRVMGTNIDYPIIYAPNYDISKKTDDFVWTDNDLKKFYNKINIAGHNILNLSSTPLLVDKSQHRFEQLLSFIYYDFAKKNEYLEFTYNNKNYLYKIFAVTIKYEDSSTGEYSKKNLKKYIDTAKKESYFDYNTDVNNNDKIISLLTCTRMFGYSERGKSFKIDARLVRTGELITNYKVTKNKNYNKIEKIWEVNKNEKA